MKKDKQSTSRKSARKQKEPVNLIPKTALEALRMVNMMVSRSPEMWAIKMPFVKGKPQLSSWLQGQTSRFTKQEAIQGFIDEQIKKRHQKILGWFNETAVMATCDHKHTEIQMCNTIPPSAQRRCTVCGVWLTRPNQTTEV